MSGLGEKCYFVRDRGRVSGPFDEDTLTQFARTRRLARHHQISTDRVQWLPAATVLPGLFRQTPGPTPPPGPIDLGPVPGESTEPSTAGYLPPRRASPGGNHSRFRTVASVTSLAVLAIVAAGIGVALWQPLPWTEAQFRNEAGPRVLVLQGIHESRGKKKFLGLAVGRKHLVMPLEAAELDIVKVGSGDDSERAWHSVVLQVVDIQAGVAGARADLGRSQKYFELDAGVAPPRNDDRLFVVGAAGDNPFVLECRLETRQNMGGPDERIMVELQREPPQDAMLLGAALLDSFGGLVGMVNATPAARRLACSPAAELATKRQELRQRPADFRIAPITLPGPPPLPPQQPAPQQPAPQQPAPPPVPSPDSPTPQAEGAGRLSKPKTTGHAAADLIDTLGSVGESVLKETSDAALPPLEKAMADRLGRETLNEILEEHPRCEDGLLVQRVRALFREMAFASKMNPDELTLTVTQDDSNNAYSFVGGHMVITSGFMTFAGDDDDMVRFVIAHELGHIALGHTELPHRRRQAAGQAAVIVDLGHGVIGMSPISQAQERDADCFAVRSLRQIGKPAEGGVRFLDRLATEEADGEEGDSGQVVVGALFGSHPDLRRRIEHIRHGCDE